VFDTDQPCDNQAVSAVLACGLRHRCRGHEASLFVRCGPDDSDQDRGIRIRGTQAPREIDPVAPRCTPGLARFQARFDVDRSARRRNQARVRELAAAHGDEIEMFCSHDPVEFDRYRTEARSLSEERT
jgi:hypothetical protein